MPQAGGTYVLGRLNSHADADPWELMAYRSDEPAAGIGSESVCFRTVIPGDRHHYLLDHQVRGRSILPAAGYVSLMVATARAAGLVPVHGDLCLVDVGFFRPLNLTRGQIQIQTSVARDAEREDGWRLAVHARAVGAERWNLYATALLFPPTPSDSIALYKSGPKGGEEPIAAYYNWWFQLGLEYGRRFRALTKLVHDGASARADLALPGDLAAWPADTIHPVVLDGAFQALGILLTSTGSELGSLPLPVAIESFTLRRPFGREGIVECALRPRSGDGRREVDLNLYDTSGRIVAQIRGLRLRGGGEERTAALVQGQADLPAG